MESLKRKRESEAGIDLPRVKYHVSQVDRAFERLLKENSREELCELIRKKLNLNANTQLELHQVRDGVLYDLEDDEDFFAFKAAAFAYKSLDIDVKYDNIAPTVSQPSIQPDISSLQTNTSKSANISPFQTNTSAMKKKNEKGPTSKKRVSIALTSEEPSQTLDLSSVLNQIADAHTEGEPSRKKQKKESTSNATNSQKSTAGAESAAPIPNNLLAAESSKTESKEPQIDPKSKSTKGKTKEPDSKEKKSDSVATTEKREQARTTGRKASTISKKKLVDGASVDTEKPSTNSSKDILSSEVPPMINDKKNPNNRKKPHNKAKEPEKSTEAGHVATPLKRKKKDIAEASKESVQAEEPPKKKKVVLDESNQASKARKETHEISSVNRMATEDISKRGSKKAERTNNVPAVTDKSAEPSKATPSVADGTSQRRTVVPLTTSSAPSLSELTGLKGRPRKLVASPTCPFCHGQFHFRFKCPVISAGVASMEKRKAELQVEGGQEPYMAELDVWIQKAKAEARVNATSSIKAAPVTSASKKAISQPPSVVPVKSKRSEVTVESQDEGSDSGTSTSDGEDDTSQTNLPSESSRSNSPRVNLANIDLDALVRGSFQNSLADTLSHFEKEEEGNKDGGSESESMQEEEGKLLEEEEVVDAERTRKHPGVSWFGRATSEISEAEEEDDDDRSSSVDNGRSFLSSVPPVVSKLRSTEVSSAALRSPHEVAGDYLEPDELNFAVNNDSGKMNGMGSAAVAEQILEGRPVTDKMTPAAEVASAQNPGDNADPSNSKMTASAVESPRDDYEDENISAMIERNTDGISSSNRTILSPVRQLSVLKTYGRSPANRRLKDNLNINMLEKVEANLTNGPPEKEGGVEKTLNVFQPSPTAQDGTLSTSPALGDNSTKPQAASTTSHDSPSSPKRRGRPPLSDAVKAERQAAKDAKAAEKKAKAEAKKALANTHKIARKPSLKDTLKEASSSKPTFTKGPSEIISKSQPSTQPSSSFTKSPIIGSQWKILQPPSETEPSPSSPQLDELIPSEASLEKVPHMINISTPLSARSVTHAIDEANVEEIIGTVDDYEDDDERSPLFLPGASQPTQVFSGPSFSRLTQSDETGEDSDDIEREGKDDWSDAEEGLDKKKQYRGGSRSDASSHTEPDIEEPRLQPVTQPLSNPKPAIKNPFPSLSQLNSSFLAGPPSFLMPSRFGTGSSQNRNTLHEVSRPTKEQTGKEDSDDEDDDDSSAEEEKQSHIPKGKRAGFSVVKRKRKGLLQD